MGYLYENNQIEIVHKELDLIQNVIQRMANNSFLIKGWTITLFVGLISFFKLSNLSDIILGICLLLIVFSFYYLDAFFLWTERKYRDLYKDVIQKRQNQDFNNLYSLNTQPYEKESIWDVIWNRKYKENNTDTKKERRRNTLALFYVPMLAISVIFICAAPFIQKPENEKITYELSVTEVQSELNTLSDTIATLRKETENISSKSVSIVSDVTAEKQTIDSINAQIKTINEQIQQILPILEKSGSKQSE
ncbi:MAG: hypothetical protein IJ630_00675 [Treponema sp.]|nr:hypothetical protein [Treponema sp.]